MALVSGGTMICWCRCSTRGEREGKAVLVGWAADRHLVGVVVCVFLCVAKSEYLLAIGDLLHVCELIQQ